MKISDVLIKASENLQYYGYICDVVRQLDILFEDRIKVLDYIKEEIYPHQSVDTWLFHNSKSYENYHKNNSWSQVQIYMHWLNSIKH